jgi:septal ring factor EnvC (AmiA/AmiB activator)
MPKTTRQLSNLNLPASAIVTEESLAAAAADASTAPAKTGDAAAGAPTDGSASESHNEQWWRDRMASARKDLDEHQRLAGALQSQIAALTTDFVNRDDPAQRARIQNDRQKAMDSLASMQKQIEADQKAITAVQDDARRANVPPGWVR